ncbi:MAG: hypothetical protein LBG47_09130 [Prevotellaceae bacterium]|nr:hypothetical protein [Prevotellaceae bacterium]
MKMHTQQLVACSILGALITACKVVAPAINASFLSEQNGIITVKSSGAGKSEEQAKSEAEKNAISTLLFRGFPESSQKTPLAGYREEEITGRHSSYFRQLYRQKRYLSFLTSSRPVSRYANKALTVEVSINLRALRADLEANGVIRKFGY